MKPTLKLLPVCLLCLLSVSCESITSLESSGGMGRKVRALRYDYRPQDLRAESLYSDSSFTIKVDKCHEQSSVEPSLGYVLGAFQAEIKANRGRIAESDQDISDVLLDVRLSRYVTRKYGRRYFKTFIDSEYKIHDSIDDTLISEEVYSISGNGESADSSNLDAMQKLAKRVLLNDRLKTFLSRRTRPKSNIISHMLDRLSSQLLKEFEREHKPSAKAKRLRIALAGFKQDPRKVFSTVFLSSLKRYWKLPRYSFFSRDQLDKILKEQSLSLSASFDETSIAELGKLKGVDYLVCGNVLKHKGETIVEAQLIRIEDAEVVASTTTSMRTD